MSRTQDELGRDLCQRGFRPAPPASSRWYVTLSYRHGFETMVVLLRARGVDLLITPMPVEDIIDEDGELHAHRQQEGSRFGDFDYAENPLDVHVHVLTIVDLFLNDQQIPESYMCKAGMGRKELKAFRSMQSGSSEMRATYTALASAGANGGADGSPVYLEDGMWLHPDGTIHEGN